MASLMLHQQMVDEQMHGWLPIRGWQREGEWRVDWCWFGEQRLTQPFYRDEVDLALRLPFNQAFRRDTPLATLLDWQAASPGLSPSVFILHASRCGSTLLAQMLARPFGAVVAAGCDDLHLSAAPEPPGQWTPDQRSLLGLPGREALATSARAACPMAARISALMPGAGASSSTFCTSA